ncbi:flagellar basal body protein FliL [Tabrizicola sp. TH137]|uniref:flagellar basal body-associated FliL family protein n=1 Tax=Tabrizicola sp. TH137 TaxID=2067452 RepID=UPI000C7DC5FB|nr:flagellar basal body-associated FliL family protein [Tabrizicola sp. TH137]PLL14609.1 flagellar basal body protein FliL [Tabrizicola sp. TH137]
MSDAAEPAAKTRPAGLKPLIAGVALAVVLGGAGFLATWSGMILPAAAPQADAGAESLPDVAFVPLDPVVVSLDTAGDGRHLRFVAQLEVASPHAGEVSHLTPRILDVLNGYLRAVDPVVLQQAGALLKIRAQLLRRIQIVTGEGRVRDLLVTEFVLG